MPGRSPTILQIRVRTELAFLLALEQALWVELACVDLSRALGRSAQGEGEQWDEWRKGAVGGGQRRTGGGAAAAGPSGGGGAAAADPLAAFALDYPEELLMLLPPKPAQGWPCTMPAAPAGAEWLRRATSLRRAQRLSFVLPTLVADLDRQALLQVSSTRERLQKCVLHLSGMRRRLAALAALAGPARARGHSDDA